MSRTSRQLLVNALPVIFDPSAEFPVGTMTYESASQLQGLREQLRGTHFVQRHRRTIEVVALEEGHDLPGQRRTVRAAHVTQLIAGLLREHLIGLLADAGRPIVSPYPLTVVSTRHQDALLQQALRQDDQLPDGVDSRIAYTFDTRRMGMGGKEQLVLTIQLRSLVVLDMTVARALELGVNVHGLYVREIERVGDPRFEPIFRLVGAVRDVHRGRVELSDHREGVESLDADAVLLEPRYETFAKVIRALFSRRADRVLTKLEHLRAEALIGPGRLKRIRNASSLFSERTMTVSPGVEVSFGAFLEEGVDGFPDHRQLQKPTLIFDPGNRKTKTWNQGGLDKFGPYDQHQFDPKNLNICVICQADSAGRVESFVKELLNGIPNTRGEIGFLRRFALQKPFLRSYSSEDDSPKGYRKACQQALEFITDYDKRWNLALVQTDEQMEGLRGDDNPYLTTTAFFLRQGIPVQHFKLETAEQNEKQRAYILNNIGLACYAKLGGIPWLLKASQKVAHEFVIGLGSYQQSSSRLGGVERVVGITTVFTGDGRYVLESKTKAVPYEDYAVALVDAIREVISKVREEFAWSDDDPVRLVFHVFKPIRNAEADAVRQVMTEMNLPHAEYAFVHLVQRHPFTVYDLKQDGVSGMGGTKGRLSPGRGTLLRLSRSEALVSFTGPREVKQATDGLPTPLLLKLHRQSSFRDITYLAQQAFDFACHSWRSFLPSPLPITILYSRLVARQLRLLDDVSAWSRDDLLGAIGRTRWFL